MRRRGDRRFKRPTNRLDHEPHILVDLVIAEPNHAGAARGKPCRSLRIMVLLLQALRPTVEAWWVQRPAVERSR